MNADQLYLFLLCILLGAACGIVYDFFFLIRSFLRFRPVRIVCDILFCLCFGGAYLVFSVALGFPSLRFYFILGLFCGLFLYLKSFHKTVAFFADKVYNRITVVWKGRKRWTRKKILREKKK